MKILGTITESDIFPDQAPTTPDQYGKPRKTVRIVLFDKDNKIALGYYPSNENDSSGEYNLPGGGVDEHETVLEGLTREVLEEVGCRMKNIRELGVIKEYGVGKKIRHAQNVHCFTAEVEGEKGEPQFTKREREDLLEVRWLPLDRAVDEITKRNQSFSRVRDLMCLESLGKIRF